MIQRQTDLGTIMAIWWAGDLLGLFRAAAASFCLNRRECRRRGWWPCRLFFAGIILILTGFKLNGRENLRMFQNKNGIRIHLLAFAIFGITFCQFTYFMAIQASNAGTATVLQYLSPVLILAGGVHAGEAASQRA